MKLQTEKISLKCKRTKNADELIKNLSSIGFRPLKSSDTISITHVESQDFIGNPRAFWTLSLMPTGFELEFTTESERHLTRRLSMLLNLFDILAICNCYNIPLSQAHSILRGPIDHLLKLTNTQQEILSNQCEKLTAECRRLSKEYKTMSQLLEKESSIRMELEKTNSILKKRLDSIDGISDTELECMVFDWIKIHGGRIRISSFSKAHGVSEVRVEQALDRLLKGGYIAKAENP
ncbi:MAG: hypothetical protein QXW70_01975 [Candidatus Anstonellales archaeon]